MLLLIHCSSVITVTVAYCLHVKCEAMLSIDIYSWTSSRSDHYQKTFYRSDALDKYISMQGQQIGSDRHAVQTVTDTKLLCV